MVAEEYDTALRRPQLGVPKQSLFSPILRQFVTPLE